MCGTSVQVKNTSISQPPHYRIYVHGTFNFELCFITLPNRRVAPTLIRLFAQCQFNIRGNHFRIVDVGQWLSAVLMQR